jgi:hypothetical protein
MPITPPTSTLQAIQTKVRRLTRSPSPAQLSDDDLNNYINTFVVYDFPEHLRMFNLRTTFTFICNPFQDEYNTDTASFAGATTNQLYNFQNNYISIADPVYIAGYQSFYSQSREQFFGIYPKTNNISSIGVTGNGITQVFTGTINSQQAIFNPNTTNQAAVLVKGEVLFSSISAGTTGEGLAMVDVPLVDPATGFQTVEGNLYAPNNLPATPPTLTDFDPNNNINYFTGNFTVTFPAPPAAGALINSQTVPQIVSLPQALLYYDNRFILRPVPDQPYRIQFEAYQRPTALLQTTQTPQLEEWWQFIAYGAARKIFQDRMDLESVQLIEPEFREQERLCLRRTIVQYTNERVATIYTEQTSFGPGSGAWGYGGGPF